MQSEEKKRSGPAMSSKENITKGDSSEDALPTESALLGPDNPTNSGEGGNDEQKGEALVIPKKAEVGEKMMNEPELAVKKRFSLIRGGGAIKPPVGKKWAKPGTVAMFADEVIEPKKLKRTSLSLKILPS